MQLIRAGKPARSWWAGPLLLLGLALGVTIDCGGGSGQPPTGTCTTGAERCPCYGNATCDVGLICRSDRCVIDPNRDGGVPARRVRAGSPEPAAAPEPAAPSQPAALAEPAASRSIGGDRRPVGTWRAGAPSGPAGAWNGR